MADAKISELTAIDAVAADDLLAIVDDPAGTPVTKKATASQIKDYIIGLANTWTATQTIDPADNTSALVVSGFSLTGSNAQSLLDLAGTWNTTGTPTAIKLNVTDTASNAASLLMDLQTGAVSRFSVSKAGGLTIQGGATLAADAGTLYLNRAVNSSGSATNSFSGPIQLSGIRTYGWADLFIGRRGAANLCLGAADAAAPVAQTLSVQSVAAGQTNVAGANFTITGSQGTGTGAGGSIIFQVAPAGSSGTAQNALTNALTLSSTGTLTFNIAPGVGTQQLVVPRIIYAGEAYRVGVNGFYTVSNGANYLRRIAANAAGGFAITNGSTGGESLEFREMTAPSAPSADAVYIYAQDNGGGKTQLMALFPTGAAQQIAIEP